MFAATSKWRRDFYCLHEYRKEVHNALLWKWFGGGESARHPGFAYRTPRKRAMCLRKLRDSGIRVVKVKVVPCPK